MKIEISEMTIESVYSHYLMSSYLYYERFPVVPWSDSQFDMACQRLLREWDSFEHIHKSLCDREALKAETGFNIKYPTVVKSCSLDWVNDSIQGV